MKMPEQESWQTVADGFCKKWEFPNCIGAIDGKHIRIKCPHHSGTMFFNYKHYFSIVLQGVADADYKFITIDVGSFGKQSDGGTFRTSSLFDALQNGQLNIPDDRELPETSSVMPYVFVGDEAYPLMRNLLRPYNRKMLDADREYFNMRLSRARRVIECAFGIINAKWRILWKPIETFPDTADIIVKAICILHNTIIDIEGVECATAGLENENLKNLVPSRANNRPSNEANFIRDSFKTYMCNNKI